MTLSSANPDDPGRVLRGRIIGADADRDVAVLQLDIPTPLPTTLPKNKNALPMTFAPLDDKEKAKSEGTEREKEEREDSKEKKKKEDNKEKKEEEEEEEEKKEKGVKDPSEKPQGTADKREEKSVTPMSEGALSKDQDEMVTLASMIPEDGSDAQIANRTTTTTTTSSTTMPPYPETPDFLPPTPTIPPPPALSTLKLVPTPTEKEAFLPPPALKPLRRGTSSDLLTGQRVFVIGNPFGLDHTMTSGLVSAVGREMASGINGRPIMNVIQTDAAINPGNSGGPVLDSDGNVVGMATAIYSASGDSSGVGFAIPIESIINSVEQILTTGRVLRPILGVNFAPDGITRMLWVNGILVLDVTPEGPAARAGLRVTTRDDDGRLILGDVITAVNGVPVRKAKDLFKQIDGVKVGESVKLTLTRSDSVETVTVTADARDASMVPGMIR